jgi:hypothetical protein
MHVVEFADLSNSTTPSTRLKFKGKVSAVALPQATLKMQLRAFEDNKQLREHGYASCTRGMGPLLSLSPLQSKLQQREMS